MTWDSLEAAIRRCSACPLAATRAHAVPGEGSRDAKLLFIGEGPGAQEDQTGRPFVGAAGQLLDKMLASIGLARQDVFIANIVKCRPPGNREPTPEEAAACLPFLRAQTHLLRPRIIVCLGRVAAQRLIDPGFRITRQRGEWLERKGFLLTATYHPSALLRDPSKKREAWADMQAIRDRYAQETAEASGGQLFEKS